MQGASVGLFFATANLFVRNIVDKSILSTAITVFMAAGSLGGMFIQYISGLLIDHYTPIYIYAFFTSLTFIAIILMIKISKKGGC
jgi:MFS family permease